MTNEAVAAILEYLCTEARNSMHTILGFMELAGDSPMDPSQRTSAAVGRASADQLLRSIDDVRELVADSPPVAAAIEELDLAVLACEVAEVMNLASGRRRKRISFDMPDETMSIAQDRKDLEQILTRVFGTALKLARGTDVRVNVARHRKGYIQLVIRTRDADLSSRLVKWLNSTLDSVSLQGPDDVPVGIAVMVAGKRLRALGGSAQETRDSAGHSSVAVDIPSLAKAGTLNPASAGTETQPDSLSVLVAEDCDESFFLTELMLPDEQVHRALDGAEALRFIQKQRFDMVLMDVHMPGMDGYSAIRRIRDWETQTGNARTPLVVLSSDDLETQKRSAAESGCSGFLRKPLRRSDLDGLIDRLKQSRRLMA